MRASWLERNVNQKSTPSEQTPIGWLLTPVKRDPYCFDGVKVSFDRQGESERLPRRVHLK